jgi:large subunit ribosomal protein L3
MVKYLLGTKIGMTRLFKTNGRVVPCTVVYAEPNVVLEVKTAEKNGAKGVKVGYLDQKENKVNKPHAGIFKKVEVPIKQYIRTFSNVTGEYSTGDLLTVEQFKQGQYVDVQGTTKGRGYTGAIFR